jgi:transposase
MLNDATCFKEVYIVCGFTDLRSGMDRLASIVEIHTGKKPYEPGTLYLFCGRRTDRIKGLVWERDGWLLLYKRLAEGRFQWPRNADEVQSLTPQQFRWLMEGLTIAPRKSVKPVDPPEYMA